jgi:hypothetical protein
MPNGRTAWTLAVSRPEALASRDEEDRAIPDGSRGGGAWAERGCRADVSPVFETALRLESRLCSERILAGRGLTALFLLPLWEKVAAGRMRGSTSQGPLPLTPTPHSGPRYSRGRSPGRRMRRLFPAHPRGERGSFRRIAGRLRAAGDCSTRPQRETRKTGETSGCRGSSARPPARSGRRPERNRSSTSRREQRVGGAFGTPRARPPGIRRAKALATTC